MFKTQSSSFPDPDRVLRVERSLFLFDLCPELGSRAPGFVVMNVIQSVDGMADFEDRLKTFLAHYDELERNLEKEDGFYKEFMVQFTSEQGKTVTGCQNS